MISYYFYIILLFCPCRVFGGDLTTFNSSIAERSFKLTCPQRQFVANLVINKGSSKLYAAEEWSDLAFDMTCRLFRNDDKVGS
jgi:hypothetical protein